MRWLITIFCLLFATGLQAQSYTVTENNCRVYFSNALDREAFWVDQLLWRHVGSNPDQLQIFDGISAITVQDANLVNYPTTDSLITQMEAWIVECDTAGQAPPVPPAPSALFANARSIEMDGSAEYVTVADADDLSFGDGTTDIPFSISFWAKWDETAGGFISKYTGQREYTIFAQSATEFRVYIYDLSAAVYLRKFGMVAPDECKNQWAHYTMTYDGSSVATGINLYLNGISLSGTSNATGAYVAMENTTAPIEVGRWNSGNIWGGKIDQVCIFRNVELTLEEIKELMTIRDVTQFTYYDSLVLYQEYDRPDSTQANGIVDLSPAGNNGSMQNGEYADLNECIEWPYPYQLDTSATVANLTPMQSDSNVSFGGFAIDYDGSAEYTEVGDNPGLSFTNDSMYISAWIQLDDATNAPIINKPSEYIFWSNASDQLEVRYIDASTGGYIGRIYSTALTIYEGQYIYVEAILNGNTSADIDLRVNGITVDDTDANSGSYTAMEDQTNDFFIGYDGVNYAGGRIGDVVLSGDILTSQYNAHAPVDMTTTGDVLAAYWRGYNSTNVASGVLDQSGNGLNGTPTNTDLADFQYTTPREIFDADTAGSVDFDGLSDYISIADSDSLTFLNQAGSADTSFSVSVWWFADDATNFPFFEKFNTSTNREYKAAIRSDDKATILLYDNGNSTDWIGVITTSTFTTFENKWNNIIYTYDGSGTDAGIKIYVNASNQPTTTNNNGTYTKMSNTAIPATIGNNDGGSLYGDGKYAHVTIMKGIALTQCQVDEVFNGSKNTALVGDRKGSPVDPRNWTFWDDSFIHYKLNQSEDLESTEGVTNISPNGSCNGTAQSMTNAANKIVTSFPTN